MSGSKSQRSLRRLVTALVIIGVLGLLLHRLWSDRSSLQGINWWSHPWYLAAHLGLLSGLFLALVLGWKLLCAACGSPMRLPAAAAVWLTPNLGKYVPGKVFLFVGRIELAHRLGMRRAAVVTALTYEHLLLMLAALPFLAAAVIRGFCLGSGVASVSLTLLCLAALIIVCFPDLLLRLLNLLLDRLGRQRLESCPQRRQMLLLLGVYGTGWLLYGASGAVLASALGLATDQPVLIAIAFVAAWLIGFLSMLTPGGLGVREAVLALLLSPVLAGSEAIALALVARLSWTAVEMAGVLLGAGLSRRFLHGDETTTQ